MQDMQRQKIRHLILPVLITGLLAGSFNATASASKAGQREDSIWVGAYGSINNWRAVSQDELILWTGPKRAYLVKIWRPFRSLRHANAIGVTRFGGRITEFDQVIVGGQRLPIKTIQRLDAKVAKAMKYQRS